MDLDQLLERFMTSVRALNLSERELIKININVSLAVTMLQGLSMSLMELDRIIEHSFIDAVRSEDRSPESLGRLHQSLSSQFSQLINGEIPISDEDGYQSAEEDDDNGRYDDIQN